MEIVEHEPWLQEIPEVGCRRHLDQEVFGRVAVLVDGRPQIFPVNYAMDDDHVVFRSGEGTKLHAIDEVGSVAFEIDGIDLERETGWSVLVIGQAQWVTKADEVKRLQQLPLVPWAHGERSNFVRIVPRSITGRRIHPAGLRHGPKA
jgi:nitroimidazol reductase NimA-like FMN-containing flavoprotein (pyridoxamine 5'-phosphate oxidase superfamily)